MPRTKAEATMALSRRAILGVAAAVPTVGGSASELFASNATAARCGAWVELDLMINRLALRWARLETQMTHDHHWFALTSEERRALPEAAEMFDIDETLETLSLQREQWLKPLSQLKVDTLHDVVSKLVIAARLMQHEDSLAQPFVASAVRELARMRCPGCGAACVPAGVIKPA
jgi:hypothetical protein